MAPSSDVAFQYGAGGKGKGLSEGKRLLSQPRGLHVDDDGTLYVADFTNFCVVRFGAGDAAGKVVAGEEAKQLMDVDYLKDIDKPLRPADGEGFLLKNPVDVVRDADGALLVLDCPMARVQRFELLGDKSAAGSVVFPPPRGPLVRSSAVPEAIKHPRSMLQHNGGMVICDTWSHRVLFYGDEASPEVLAGTANSCGSSSSQLNFPSGCAFLSDGSLLVADTNNHRIQRFLPGELSGQTVAGSPEGKPGDGLSELQMPTGIVVEADDCFLVADRANARVMRFRAGNAGEVVAGPDLLERPWGLALGKDGSIFVSDERRAVVLKLAPTTPAKGAVQTAPGHAKARPSGGYPDAMSLD
ncbi:unnamed protein product [Effrenium voratum]|uniref:NHL repeat containing protein n=1 Tax=Effrenium voratum TaxID=2562239 RepID=A0AA36MRP7_9DINO|nr:unnamed protein product [Effrenium voratum]CAJ1423802.1 unnamed protein product [Effrenium voratum]